jgi:hypothetical protein
MLAEREGLVFVEGMKPRVPAAPESSSARELA